MVWRRENSTYIQVCRNGRRRGGGCFAIMLKLRQGVTLRIYSHKWKNPANLQAHLLGNLGKCCRQVSCSGAGGANSNHTTLCLKKVFSYQEQRGEQQPHDNMSEKKVFSYQEQRGEQQPNDIMLEKSLLLSGTEGGKATTRHYVLKSL